MEEEDIEKLLYVIPATVIALALLDPSDYRGIVLLSLASSGVLFFLGYPSQAFATLLSGLLSLGALKLSSIEVARTVTTSFIETTTSIKVVTVTVTKREIATETVTLNETVLETRYVTVRDCSREVVVTSYENLGVSSCYGKLACSGSKEIYLIVGRGLRLRETVVSAVTVYLPVNGTLAPCGEVSVKPGYTIVVARPYYGQPPATVTIRMKTESR